MKKKQASDSAEKEVDELQPEYRFDYRKARSNRFASEIAEGSMVVVLEPEIARVFQTEEAVKAILRAIAEAMPREHAK